MKHETDTARRFITTYTPTMPAPHWQPIAEFVRDAVRDSDLDTYEQVRRALIFTAAFVQWAYTTCGLPLERDEIFTATLVEEFTIAHRAKYSTQYIERNRLCLLSLTATLTGDDSRAALRSANDRCHPYASTELAHFRSWAGGQPTARQRHNALTILTLAAGCGLRPPEIRMARPEDIRLKSATPGIRVGRELPRFVPVLATWAEELERLAAGCSTEWVFTTKASRNEGNTVPAFLRCASGIGARPTPARLRSTWIVTHLNSDTHAPALLRAAGLTSLGSLDGYLPWVDPRPDHDNQLDLRQAVAA
ncbi:hypothetical protein [Plantibacter sp. YIM 135249]|uniref:hypothetical protein n=1 Tax=Plantibacter sp. YIM 135249 TaxID=3423918 RepID=UPI003D34B098